MSLLLSRDLLVLSILILCFLLVFAVMAATRAEAPDRRRPK